jgi:hypothetical protein
MEPFKGWAILELMGHRRLAGFVQEVTLAGAGMLRIDVPGKDGNATQFFSPSSVYALTPCSEATARAVAGAAPVNEWELPSLRGKALPAGRGYGDGDEGDDFIEDETPRETLIRLVNEEGLDAVLRGLVEVHDAHGVDGRHDDQARRGEILSYARDLVLAGQWPPKCGFGDGLHAITIARNAQIAQGYDVVHDYANEPNLAAAAAWLIVWGGKVSVSNAPEWVTAFGSKYRESDDEAGLLANAGALIVAEIERLKRLEAKAPPIDAQAADLASAHPSGIHPDPPPVTAAAQEQIPI